MLIDYAKFFLAPKFTNGKVASLPLYGRSILSLPSHYRNLSSYLTSANPADPQSQLAYSGFIFLNHYKAYQYHLQALFWTLPSRAWRYQQHLRCWRHSGKFRKAHHRNLSHSRAVCGYNSRFYRKIHCPLRYDFQKSRLCRILPHRILI